MKKKNSLKKFIAGIVSSAMVLSSFVFPVETVKAADDIIDAGREVSLTIYKYETDKTITEQTVTGRPGKGVELDNTAIKNEGYKPLKDVEFTVYKIADIIQETVDGETRIKYKTVEELKTTAFGEYVTMGLEPSVIKSNYDSINWDEKSVFKVTGKTDENGFVKFANGDLAGVGLYLVAETAWPAKVTSPVNPFLVSLPTTMKTTVVDKLDSEWIYNVYAYPKNSTMAKSIAVNKFGKVGNASQVALPGAKFMLQKETATDVWTTQVVDTDGAKFKNTDDTESIDGILTTGAGGTATFTNLAPGTYRIIEVSAPNEYIAESDVPYEFEITTDGKVKVGAEDRAYINVVNVKPTVTKTVLKKGTSSEWAKIADYSTGRDVIKFKIEVDIPSNIAKLNTFAIRDEFVAELFTNIGEFSYEGTKAGGSTETLSLGTVLDIKDDNTGWTLALNETDRATLAAYTKLTIQFQAKLSNALGKAITEGAGNVNNVYLDYTNHTYSANTIPDSDSTTDEISTITDSAKVYTFALIIDNIFEGTSNTPRTGIFNLYEEAEDGDIILNGKKVKLVLSGIEITEDVPKTINTENYGVGLSNGTYYLVQTDTFDGYNLLKEPVKVIINDSYNETGMADGHQTTSVSVLNNKGFSFPVTGGRGTIIFTITGLTLMIVGICVFFTSRKRKTN